MSEAEPVVRYLDQTAPVSCPYGEVARVVTGGLGGVANVHVVTVSEGKAHYHAAYDEVYYVLAGRGTLWIEPMRAKPAAANPEREPARRTKAEEANAACAGETGAGGTTGAGCVEEHPLRPGAVVVLPAGCVHALRAEGAEPLRFIIFGTPPVPINDPRARPQAPRALDNPDAPEISGER